MISRAPVALFVFNRADTTRRVMAAVRAARPERLFVIADGPRASRPGEAAACEAARKAALDIDWPCEVHSLLATSNLGCNERIASGLDWLFARTDRAILLEDDCVPGESFFPYCNELLQRYAEEPRVHMISGSTFTPGRRFTRDSYYFSRFCHVWGWATWARAWRTYDPRMEAWPRLRDQGWLEQVLPSTPMADAARKVFDDAHAGRLFVWDYAWVLAGWSRNAWSAVPAVNLVSNIGFGPAATHTRQASHPLAALPVARLAQPLRHPPRIAVLEAADRCEWSFLNPGRQKPGLRQRWLEYIAARRDSAAAA